MPIKLTSTLEGDLIVEHMVANMLLSLHIVVSDSSVHISQEIFANDILTALKPSFRT